MILVLTRNSVYRITFPASGAVIRATKLSAHRASPAIPIGQPIDGHTLTLAVGQPMVLGDALRTSPVVAILPDDRS